MRARSFEVCGGRCRSCVSGNGIGGAGAASIAEALALNTTITSVDLGSECCDGRVSANDIGDAGAASIAEALKLNTTITSVDLECECRTGAGVVRARSLEVGGWALSVVCFRERHRWRGCGVHRGGAEVEHDHHERESGG